MRYLVLLLLLGCKSEPHDCLAGDADSVKRYEDCNNRCSAGNHRACDKRSELESLLSQACSKKNNVSACKAICFGRAKSESACQQLKFLGSGG